jgi:hypothetical protein
MDVGAPAVVAAIHDAIGAWITDLPATPERVLAALGATGPVPPPAWSAPAPAPTESEVEAPAEPEAEAPAEPDSPAEPEAPAG